MARATTMQASWSLSFFYHSSSHNDISCRVPQHAHSPRHSPLMPLPYSSPLASLLHARIQRHPCAALHGTSDRVNQAGAELIRVPPCPVLLC